VSSSNSYNTKNGQARKGLIDTALRTTDAGHLTHRRIDVVQAVVIPTKNCESDEKGVSINDIHNSKQTCIIKTWKERLIGRAATKRLRRFNIWRFL